MVEGGGMWIVKGGFVGWVGGVWGFMGGVVGGIIWEWVMGGRGWVKIGGKRGMVMGMLVWMVMVLWK